MKLTPPEKFFSDPLQVRLAAAVDRGDEAGVLAAVNAGADVNARGRDGYNLLYWSMARENVAGFESLVKQDADVTLACRDRALMSDPRLNDRPIRLSLAAKNPKFLEVILRHGFDPDYVLDESSGSTLLFGAVYDRSESAIGAVLDAGGTIDHRDKAGYTALVSAGQIRNYKVVWFLLQRGADPTVGSDEGKDLAAILKTYGSRGVLLEQQEYFEKVVDELIRRGLLTRQDIFEADKPKSPNSGITVIEHPPDSEAGQAILELDRRERESNARDRAK